MKRGYVYTIVFMLIVSAVFTFFLAGTNALTAERIAENSRLDEMKSVLYAFNLDAEGTNEAIAQRFTQAVQKTETSNLTYYTHIENGETKGYAVPFAGGGLWGTIRGWLAVSPDLAQVQGLVFTDQNETPGLGGRIVERWYTDQFRGVKLDLEGPLTYGVKDGVQLDAITGATQSSNAVLRILNEVRAEVLPLVEVK